MKDIKFTNDGKKVVVVGKLNNNETIVQEIFVTAKGDEIPSGENFVTKSLHDEPVESYAARNARQIKQRIKSLEKERDDLYENLENERRKVYALTKTVKEKASWIRSMCSKIDEESFDNLILFMSGDVTHIVIPNDYKIYGFDEYFSSDYGIKLLSMYGNTQGDISFKVNEYGDGSGSWRKIIPVKSFKDGVEIIKNDIIRYITNTPDANFFFYESMNKALIDYDIKLSDDMLYKIHFSKLKRLESDMETSKHDYNERLKMFLDQKDKTELYKH